MAIAADGVVTFSQIPVMSAGLNVSGGTITGTIATASQTNITGVGTLNAGAISSGFGNIDTGSSTITTTGAISGGSFVVANGANIGSTGDTDAIAIASDGVVTMNQIPVFSAGINVSGGSIAGTLSTAAQGNITSLGTLTTLTVDNIIINGTTIGHTSDTDAITIASDGKTTFSQQTTHSNGIVINDGGNIGAASDTDAIAIAGDGKTTFSQLSTFSSGLVIADGGNIGSASDTDAISIAADGKVSLTQDLYLTGSQKELRFYEGANYVGFKAPSLSGNQIWSLPATDASSNGDALVSDGAGGLSFSSTVGSNATSVTLADESSDTSCFVMFATAATGNQDPKTGSNLTFNSSTGALTASSFVGNITGNVTGNVSGSAATVTGAAQSSITSLGTLTTLTVDNIIINGTNIGHTSDTDAIAIASDGKVTFSQQTTHSNGILVADGGTIGSASDTNAISIGADGDVTLTQDLELQKDGAILYFGQNDDVKIKHVADKGLEIYQSTTDDIGMTLTFNALDTAIEVDHILGKIEFKAGNDSSGSDAILPGAYISAVAEGTFSASNNATKIDFATGISETATPAMSLSSTGSLSFPNKQGGDNLRLDSTNGTADAGDDVILNGTDGSSTNADSNIIFEDAVALTTQTDRHVMKRMMGEFNSEQEDIFPNKLRLIKSDGSILKTYHCAGDA